MDNLKEDGCTNMERSSLIEALRKAHYYLTMNLPLPKDDIDLIIQSLRPYGLIEYPNLWLTREGDFTDVRIEINKQWITLIRENYDGHFSHIIRSSGIKRLITNAIDAREG